MPVQILIDADPLVYRAVFSKEGDTIGGVADKVEELFNNIIAETQEVYGNHFQYKAYLTGKTNFRHTLTKDYKANRPKEKPVLLNFAREYVLDNYVSELSEGEEADDAIAIAATQFYPDVVIVSIDKDFKQVPCTLYNPVKKVWSKVEPWDGLVFFYTQLLVGDRADNIEGVWKVGPVSAEKILKGATTELELWKRCLEAYEGNYDRAVMNGQLLWLRREKDQLWTPPVG